MAALDDYKTLLTSKAADIAFDMDRALYLVAIDNWFPLAQARQALSVTGIHQYSISGRTVTKSQLPELIRAEQQALIDVLKFLKLAGEGLVDTRWFEGNRVGIYTS
jgi:hypothetical protein